MNNDKVLKKYKENGIEVLERIPKDWVELNNTATQPKGYKWYSNNKSRFSGEYKHALVKTNDI